LILIGTGGAHADTPVETRVLHDSGSRIVVDYRFGDYESRRVGIDGTEHEEIFFAGEPVNLDAGAPALPHVSRSLVIPDDARMTLRVLASDYREIFTKIAPSKGNLLRSVDPDDVPYEFGQAYRTNAFYPGPLATLGTAYVLRDLRGIVVRINPFQYNPVTGVLRVYESVTVEVKADGPGRTNVLNRSLQPERPSRAFRQIFGSHFLNPPNPGTRYAPMDEEGDMLIISHDPWIANLAPFVTHKAAVGVSASVVGVSTIGNSATSIKNYIQETYDTSNLAFVLLVGDIAEVDSFMVSGGASDPSYSKLAGNDDYPDILVGRFSAANEGQVDTQVQRTISYETQPATEQDWFWKGAGLASAEGAGIGDEGQSDIQHAEEIRGWLLDGGYTDVDQIYDPGAYASQVSVAVNAGRGVINYTGHGWPQGWSTSGFDSSDVNSLTNTGMLPFIVSVACNNGEFESYGTCFAEAWMRATHNGQPSGAIGIYASSISQSWAPPMEGQDEFNLLLTDPDEPYHTLGALCFAGSASMMDDYGSSGVNMFDTWILFGDPSLRVRGSAGPQGLIVEPATVWRAEGHAGGPFTPEAMQYTLTNSGSGSIFYSVAAGVPWLSVNRPIGMIAGGDSVVVEVSIDPSVRSFDNGMHGDLLRFTNLTSHEGDAVRRVELSIGVPVLHSQWSLDDTAGWMTSGEWAFGPPTGQGGDFMGHPDPDSGASGNNVYGVNLSGDYPAVVGGPYRLSTGSLGLEGTHGATVRFQRWLNTEAPPKASVAIDVSSGASLEWTRLWQNTENIAEDTWSAQSYSIAAVADGRPNAQVRWSYEVLSEDALPCSGWNIDDVEIWAVPEGTARIALDVARDGLSWTAIQGAVAYDVVLGDLETLIASGGDFTAATQACVADEVEATSDGYAGNPDPGQGHWILVRGVSSQGPMTFQALYPSQVGLRDEEIQGSGVGCP
jgi:gingipain R